MRWSPVCVAALGLALSTLGCAAIHQQQVDQMRADGDPRADCYAACEPGDAVCMNDCDRGQPTRATQDLGDDIIGTAMSGDVDQGDIDRLRRKQQEAMKQEAVEGMKR